MTTKGTADKEAIIDCIVWGDFPLDSNFKQLLLLPIVRAPDDEVWDTLIRQLPLYLRKRLDGQLRAARLDLELSGPDSRFVLLFSRFIHACQGTKRSYISSVPGPLCAAPVSCTRLVLMPLLATVFSDASARIVKCKRLQQTYTYFTHTHRSVEVVRSTVVLMRHILHVLSTLLGLVHRRAIELAGGNGQSCHSVEQTSQTSHESHTISVSPHAATSSPAASDRMLPSEDDAGPPTPDVADGEHEGFTKDWACVSDIETSGCSSGSVLQGINEQLSLHVSEVERARISVNLLRTLVQAELGMWDGGFVAFASETKPDDQRFGDENVEGKRRRFSRATSLCVSALLNQALGVAVFINCKSGLDRTGLQTGMQACQSALWGLYPHQRWSLHLAAINWHLLQARHSEGKEEHFNQPSTADSFASEQDRLVWFRSLLRERSMIRSHRLHAFPPSAAGNGDGKNMYSDDWLVFEDNGRMLRALYPLSCLCRNYMLAYLIEANAVITFASTGVRGMKYDGHPLIGSLVPREVRVSPVNRTGGCGVGVEREIRTCALFSRQYLGLKGLAGGKLAQDTLTDLGRLLLVDASRYRSS